MIGVQRDSIHSVKNSRPFTLASFLDLGFGIWYFQQLQWRETARSTTTDLSRIKKFKLRFEMLQCRITLFCKLITREIQFYPWIKYHCYSIFLMCSKWLC
jgi:hypothetical protein